jgi:hypothetical protein
MSEEKLNEAQKHYYESMRQATPEELEESAKRQAEGCRAMSEEEIREHQIRMWRLHCG